MTGELVTSDPPSPISTGIKIFQPDQDATFFFKVPPYSTPENMIQLQIQAMFGFIFEYQKVLSLIHL